MRFFFHMGNSFWRECPSTIRARWRLVGSNAMAQEIDLHHNPLDV
jgi:hypothetical protein